MLQLYDILWQPEGGQGGIKQVYAHTHTHRRKGAY